MPIIMNVLIPIHKNRQQGCCRHPAAMETNMVIAAYFFRSLNALRRKRNAKRAALPKSI